MTKTKDSSIVGTTYRQYAWKYIRAIWYPWRSTFFETEGINLTYDSVSKSCGSFEIPRNNRTDLFRSEEISDKVTFFLQARFNHCLWLGGDCTAPTDASKQQNSWCERPLVSEPELLYTGCTWRVWILMRRRALTNPLRRPGDYSNLWHRMKVCFDRRITSSSSWNIFFTSCPSSKTFSSSPSLTE